jgi:hypothetical protein
MATDPPHCQMNSFSSFRVPRIRVAAQPLWPAVSVALLIVLSKIGPSWLITGLNMYLVLLALVALMVTKRPLDPGLARCIGCFGVILVLGCLSGYTNELYAFGRDVWYVVNALMAFLAGYVLCIAAGEVGRILKAAILAGTLMGLVQLSPFFADPSLVLLSAVAIREAVGTGFFAPALALAIVVGYRSQLRQSLKMSPITAGICVTVCLLAVVLTFSRTIVLMTIASLLIVLGAKGTRLVWILAGGAAVLILSAGLYGGLADLDSSEARSSFLGKMARSAEELWISDYSDMKSISDNWRGYETAQALKQYANGTPLNWLAGQGFGTLVKLGVGMRLGGSGDDAGRTLYHAIPVLHNGYAYLLIKGGAIAVAAYLAFLAMLWRIGSAAISRAPADVTGRAAALVLRSVAAVLAISTWVISGAFNKSDLTAFLIVGGALFASLSALKAHGASTGRAR